MNSPERPLLHLNREQLDARIDSGDPKALAEDKIRRGEYPATVDQPAGPHRITNHTVAHSTLQHAAERAGEMSSETYAAALAQIGTGYALLALADEVHALIAAVKLVPGAMP